MPWAIVRENYISMRTLFLLHLYSLVLLLSPLFFFSSYFLFPFIFIIRYQHDTLTNLGILLSLSYIYFHILYYVIYLLLLFILYYTFSFVYIMSFIISFYIMSFYYFVIYDYYFYIPINFIIVYFLLIFNLL